MVITFNPDVGGAKGVVVGVHEGVGETHPKLEGSGGLLGSNDIEQALVGIAILLLVELSMFHSFIKEQKKCDCIFKGSA